MAAAKKAQRRGRQLLHTLPLPRRDGHHRHPQQLFHLVPTSAWFATIMKTA